MQDGHTRKRKRPEPPAPIPPFLRENRAALVVESGTDAGKEIELAQPEQIVGRGEHVPIRFADDAMSREHAAFEVTETGFRVRDLGSTNGIVVNDEEVLAAGLEHGDRVEIGEHVLRYVVEPRTAGPRVWTIEED